MPFGDRRGPRGFGPMTGRAAGYCAGVPMPGCANPGAGFGCNIGWMGGLGRRHRRWFRATGQPFWVRGAWGAPSAYGPWDGPMPQEQETALLEGQADWLRQQLEALEAQIAELRRGSGNEKDQDG